MIVEVHIRASVHPLLHRLTHRIRPFTRAGCGFALTMAGVLAGEPGVVGAQDPNADPQALSTVAAASLEVPLSLIHI